jgi:biopolymer transport protein TolR
MRSRRRREGMALNGEINVVSLIDVMMLLMVIFMIAAPMMQGGIDINLPKVDTPALESKSALTISIDRNGRIFVDKASMSDADFNRNIKLLASAKGKDGVYLQADKSVSWDRVGHVMGMMIQNGVTNVGMVTEPVDNKQ